MENFKITLSEDKLEIYGIPDAVEALSLDKKNAKYITDLSLHQYDLKIAKESIGYIIENQTNLNEVIIESLWRSAIVHFTKCFSDQVYIKRKGQRREVPDYSRKKLERSEVYTDCLASEAFDKVMELRNKHIVHDEFDYINSTPGFVINDGSKEYKIEKVFYVITRSITYDRFLNNLNLLILDAMNFVENQSDLECKRISNYLESFDYNELKKFGGMVIDGAGIITENKTRK